MPTPNPIVNENETQDTDHTTVDPLTLRAALDSVRPQLEAMPASEVNRMPRLDAAAAAGVAIGSLPAVARHRDEVVAQCGEPAAKVFDELPVIAYATHQAHVEVVTTDDDSDLRETHRGLLEEHGLLLTDTDSLANRKLIDRKAIEPARSTQGYRTTVDSVLVLVSLLRDAWPRVEHKTPLTLEDLSRAESKAQEMLERLSQREQRAKRLPALELRARALTRLLYVYGQVRRYLTFVRWQEDDVETIAPSLYTARRNGRRVEDREGTEPVAPATPIQPGGPALGGNPFTS